jgi:hypothetical protein
VMPIPDPSPDAGRRRDWKWPRRCLFRVTVGGPVSVLVPAAAASFGTATVWRSVIAPQFETAVAIVPTALRRCSGSTADQQHGGCYKIRKWLHKPLRCLLLISGQLVRAVRVPSGYAHATTWGFNRNRNPKSRVSVATDERLKFGVSSNPGPLARPDSQLGRPTNRADRRPEYSPPRRRVWASAVTLVTAQYSPQSAAPPLC